jgi:hypothetical protein
MAKQTINVGTTANDGTGDTLRLSQQKANNNFNDLYDNGGANITVVNPVTEANSTLNQALVDVNGGGGGSTPTLQEVLEEGNTTNETAIFGDIANDYLTVSSDNILIVDAENETSSSLTSSVFSIGDNTLNYAQIDLINGFQTGNFETNTAYLKGNELLISNPLAQSGLTANQLYFTNFDEENPASAVFSIDKLQTVSGEYLYPTGTSSPLATLANIPTIDVINDLKDFQTREGFYVFEDFIGNPGSSVFNSYGVSNSALGAGAVCITNTTYPNRTNQQGVVQMGAGTTTTGAATIRIGDNNVGSHYLGNGVYTMQFFANIETLSDATNRFYNFFGATATNNVLSTNIIAFIYDEGGASANIGAASPNWKCITRVASTVSATITTVPIVAGQWFVLRIVVNADATSVQFFINNVLVATHTTNIPTLLTPRIAHVKTAGTTNRNIFVDYMLVEQIYTTPRTI